MTTTTQHPLTLVTGATGKTGRRVADRLTARGLPVRLGSRSATPAFDWTDRATWDRALAGADAAYVAFQPDLAVPGAAETIAAFSERAVAHGVRRLVLLSGRGEPEAQRCEQAVLAVDAEVTIVRASWFAQNFSESFLLDGVLAGEVALPADTVREPCVDADDIADVAVAALTEPGHAGEVYEVTGPQLLTFAEAVAEVARVTGRDVRFTPVPLEAWTAAVAAEGAPPDVVELLRYLFSEVLDGRNAYLTDGVRRALGRRPLGFGDYARATAATGAGAAQRAPAPP